LAQITAPAPLGDKANSVSHFLELLSRWQQKHESAGPLRGFLSQLWYRGVQKYREALVPGVYRDDFTAAANQFKKDGDVEAKRLHLEREMLSQFRTAGAGFIRGSSQTEIYFAAQHFGMRTRLLDWSTNPLAALFFACESLSADHGAVYVMDARQVVPADAMKTPSEKLYLAVMTMRHPFVEYAVGLSFWNEPKPDWNPFVLPVRPDNVPGRIGQQSSCFTLHMHHAHQVDNPSLITIAIDAHAKERIVQELRRLNVNQFTTYYDLDHLAREIKFAWGLRR
jgi:hypothetical protein